MAAGAGQTREANLVSKDLIAKLRSLARVESQIHGPAHWVRVVKFGTRLAKTIPLSRKETFCVQLFGWTHDLARIGDDLDKGHGPEGALYLREVVEKCRLRVPPDCLAIVKRAIRHHSDAVTADQAAHLGFFADLPWNSERRTLTIGACWDADRLDLLRLGIDPHPSKMSTPNWEDVLPYARRPHDYW